MIDADDFLGPALGAGYGLYVGVPCSFLDAVISRAPILFTCIFFQDRWATWVEQPFRLMMSRGDCSTSWQLKTEFKRQ